MSHLPRVPTTDEMQQDTVASVPTVSATSSAHSTQLLGSGLRCSHALATASVTANNCANCASRQQRAALVTQYLRQALPPISTSSVLVLPSFAPMGQLVLSCDTRLPDAPYEQESSSGKMSGVAARRRASRLAVQWLRQDRQLQANLMWAVRFNDLERVRQLVALGSDVNEPDALGRTALHVAASQGYTEMVELLLSLGSRPDPQDRRQNTPLHLAVCTSRWAVIQKLLSAGADVWSVNGSNMSALQLARSKLNMVIRLKGQGTLDFDKHIEELKAVHDLVKSALSSAPGATPATDPGNDPDALANVLDQIEQLSISGQRPAAAPSVAQVNDELRAMNLTSSDADQKLKLE